MRRFLIALLVGGVLGTTAGELKAAHTRHPDTYSLKKAHKQQRMILKEQQRAIKKTMGQHHLSSQERHLFEHELKVQKKTLRNQQKSESRRLQASRKTAAHTHVTALNSSP